MGALYGLLLISGIFAAWQAHQVWWSPKEGPAPEGPVSPSPRALRPLPRTRPAPLLPTRPAPASQSQPAEVLAEDVFPDPAVEKLAEDPVGIDPPPGAAGLRAFALPSSGVMARYVWKGTMADAAEHYQQRLREQGCKLLDHSTDESGRQSWTFAGEGRRVIVALRADPQEARMVDIDVTVIRLSK